MDKGSESTISSESSRNVKRESRNKAAGSVVKRDVRKIDFGIDREGNEEKALIK